MLASIQATENLVPEMSETTSSGLMTNPFYQSDDDTEEEEADKEARDAVEQTAAIRWASVFPGVGIGDWGYKQAFGSDPLFFVKKPKEPKCKDRYLNQLFPRERVPRFDMETCPQIWRSTW